MGKFDKEIGEATAETNTTENWQKFMDLADSLQRANFDDCRDAARALHRRLKDRNALAVSYTVSLVHALVNNGGAEFRKAFFSRDTLPVLKHVLQGRMPAKVKKALGSNIAEWNKDFGSRPEFRIISSWEQELTREGLMSKSATATATGTGASASFSSFPTASSGARTAPSTAPSFLSAGNSGASAVRQREEEQKYEADLAEAIKASLNETGGSSARTHPAQQPRAQPTGQPVKVLYDFEGSEENELSLSAGDIIKLTDKSDPNWWRGISRGGDEGFFPSSFVSFDLNAEVVPDAPPANEEEEEDAEEEVEKDAVGEDEEDGAEVVAVEEAAPVLKQDATPSASAQEQPEGQAEGGAGAIDASKFERFFELVTTTQPGDHSHDDEIEALEKQCDAAIDVVSENVDSYDRRLARINQMMEKYALIQALCTRLMAQEPGMARVTRAPHELGVGMQPPQQPAHPGVPPQHPHHAGPQRPPAPYPGAPQPAHHGAAAGYPPHPQQHQQPSPHASGMGPPQHYGSGRQQPPPMAGQAPPSQQHMQQMQQPSQHMQQQHMQQQHSQHPPQFAYAGTPPPQGSHASNAPYQQQPPQQQPPQQQPPQQPPQQQPQQQPPQQPQGSAGYRPPQVPYSQPPTHPHYHEQQQGPPQFPAQAPHQYHEQQQHQQQHYSSSMA